MGLNISTIQPAIEKAKNVATEQYVDTSVANIDISQTLNTNNDVFAQRLGYMDYADMVASAESGQTIINGGYLRGELIEANSINANQINTTGLVAENIRSNTIIGNDIYGSKIEGVNIIGARINGAVIKASYLDLDGELEVLTNYHISVAMFNSNPSLYTDAVFISTDNEYRIPSMSIVSEPPQEVSGTVGYSILYGKIMPYNNANSGTNIKAVKIRPTFNIISPIILAVGTINSTVNIYLGSNHLLRVIVDDLIANNHYDDSITANCYSSYWGTNEIRVRVDGSKSLSITGVPIFDFLVNISIIDGIRKFTISSNPKVSTIPFDWTSGSLVIESTGEIVTKTLGPQIQINNMI